MSEQTGFPASTLHAAMALTYDDDLESDEYEMLSADLVIVDECSMVDMRLAYALFVRLKPGAQLIMVGDPDQLPSVGPGNVLREMIRSQMIPTAILDIVFRQASNSLIAMNAQAVNHNNTHLLYGEDFAIDDVKDAEEANRLIDSTTSKKCPGMASRMCRSYLPNVRKGLYVPIDSMSRSGKSRIPNMLANRNSNAVAWFSVRGIVLSKIGIMKRSLMARSELSLRFETGRRQCSS